MNTLHDRINRVINTPAFELCLEQNGTDLLEFQCTWNEISKGDFDRLPKAFQAAIIAAEKELESNGVMDLATAT